MVYVPGRVFPGLFRSKFTANASTRRGRSPREGPRHEGIRTAALEGGRTESVPANTPIGDARPACGGHSGGGQND